MGFLHFVCSYCHHLNGVSAFRVQLLCHHVNWVSALRVQLLCHHVNWISALSVQSVQAALYDGRHVTHPRAFHSCTSPSLLHISYHSFYCFLFRVFLIAMTTNFDIPNDGLFFVSYPRSHQIPFYVCLAAVRRKPGS
jgi:hypothetical protein